MGLRFNLKSANWLSNFLDPTKITPELSNKFEELETLKYFVKNFTNNYYTSQRQHYILERQLDNLRYNLENEADLYYSSYTFLKGYFRNIPWISLLLPSGKDRDSDELLTSPNTLKTLVSINPEDPGLILQLEEPPEKIIALENIFPAFKLSLSNHTRWPGILLWNMAGDSIFLELSKEKNLILERLTWTYRELAKSIGTPNLKSLEKKFNNYFNLSSTDETVRILHLSDLHLGSSISNKRLPRIFSLIESQLAEFADETPIIPVISGDLMDSPNKENLSNFRLFEGFLNSKGFKQPVIVLGNHDVRKDGWLWSLFKTSLNISTQPVYWFDDYKIGFICFNSVNAGYLARGFIGEEEFLHIGNALDKEKTKSKEYTLIGVLHHHPIPVEIPDWYRKSWYERIFGNKFEKSEELEDSIPFLAWIKARNIKIILHGHKHIPRVDIHDDINIIGCGSSTGKINSSETGETFISMNLITLDRNRKSISCRLKAERIPGGGINSVASHELAISREIY